MHITIEKRGVSSGRPVLHQISSGHTSSIAMSVPWKSKEWDLYQLGRTQRCSASASSRARRSSERTERGTQTQDARSGEQHPAGLFYGRVRQLVRHVVPHRVAHAAAEVVTH